MCKRLLLSSQTPAQRQRKCLILGDAAQKLLEPLVRLWRSAGFKNFGKQNLIHSQDHDHPSKDFIPELKG